MIEHKLNDIQAAVKKLEDKFDTLIVGTNGHDGVIPRLSKVEGRQSTLSGAFAIITLCGTVFLGFLGFRTQ